MNDTELDALLAPAELPHPATLDSDLMILVSDAQLAARRARRRPRIVAGGVALTLALGGATAAAAASGVFSWEPDMQAASGQRFTVPSGVECEVRTIVEQGDPATVARAEEIVATMDIATDINIAGMLALEQEGQSQDRKLLGAVSSAVQGYVIDTLLDEGYDISGFGIASQADCGVVLE